MSPGRRLSLLPTRRPLVEHDPRGSRRELPPAGSQTASESLWRSRKPLGSVGRTTEPNTPCAPGVASWTCRGSAAGGGASEVSVDEGEVPQATVVASRPWRRTAGASATGVPDRDGGRRRVGAAADQRGLRAGPAGPVWCCDPWHERRTGGAHREVDHGADLGAMTDLEAGTRPAPENAPWAGPADSTELPAVPA